MVEQWTFNPKVLGSNPNILTKNDIYTYKLHIKYKYFIIFSWSIRAYIKQEKYFNNNYVNRTYVTISKFKFYDIFYLSR